MCGEAFFGAREHKDNNGNNDDKNDDKNDDDDGSWFAVVSHGLLVFVDVRRSALERIPNVRKVRTLYGMT